jgi:hypothetical protein
MIVPLQGQSSTGLDHNSFDLKTIALVDGLVTTPGPVNFTMLLSHCRGNAFDFVDQLPQLVAIVAVGNQDSVIGCDDHEIIHA